MANGTTIFAGPIYTVICEKTENQIRLFNVFAEDEISLHVFMVAFVKDRDYFRYDTYFPHYAMFKVRRAGIIEGGAVAVSKEGEESCVHDWQKRAMEKRFM